MSEIFIINPEFLCEGYICEGEEEKCSCLNQDGHRCCFPKGHTGFHVWCGEYHNESIWDYMDDGTALDYMLAVRERWKTHPPEVPLPKTRRGNQDATH